MKLVYLRDYQSQLVHQIHEAFASGEHRVCLQCPTGSGKSEMAISLMQSIIQRDPAAKLFFVVHRRELLRQVANRVIDHDMLVSYIAAGMPRRQMQLEVPNVIICSIQTLVKRLGAVQKPSLMIIDECHHASSSTYKQLFEYYPDVPVLGLTATPRRLDKKPLYPIFTKMIKGPPPMELIEAGWLARPEIFVPEKSVKAIEDMSTHWHTSMGDYKTSEMDADLLDSKLIYGDAIEHYKQYANGERALVFCTSIAHCKHTAIEFNHAGIPSEPIDGTMSDIMRQALLDRFRSGETLCVMSNDLLGEGFDCPNASAAILLRPTKSLTVHLQQCGRVLRPAPGKTSAKIFDHVNNCSMTGHGHGPPWLDRHWTLEAYDVKEKRDTLTGVNLKLCGICGQYVPSGDKVCANCSYVFVSATRESKPAIHVAGQLVKLTPDMVLAREKRKMARSYDDLLDLARDKGYRNPEQVALKWRQQDEADDEIFFKGSRDQLIELYTRRKKSNPAGEADKTLAGRAKAHQERGATAQHQVFTSGTFDEIVKYINANLSLYKKVADGAVTAEQYARGVLKKRLQTVLYEGTLEQAIEAAGLMGITGNPEAYIKKLRENAPPPNTGVRSTNQPLGTEVLPTLPVQTIVQSSETPHPSPPPSTGPDPRYTYEGALAFAISKGISNVVAPGAWESEAQKFAMNVVLKHNKAVIETGSEADALAVIRTIPIIHNPEKFLAGRRASGALAGVR